MNIQEWFDKWQIPQNARYDFINSVCENDTSTAVSTDMGENLVQSKIRLEASKKGMRLWRNNVGAVTTEDGRHIRFGLCNESKRMNDNIKSSDLVGIKPVTIEQHHVGLLFGQFIAREVKNGAWMFKNTEREQAQLRFIQMVNSLGGDAKFANSEGTL